MKKILLFSFALLLLTQNVHAADFSDVREGQINKEAIDYLQGEGVVQGYADNTFKFLNRINRAEFTKITIESLFTDEEINACKTSDFLDVPTTEWYAKYVCMAVKHNIVSGYDDKTFKPAAFINFAEASKIITEAKDVIGSDEGTNKEWFAKYVKGLEEKKAIPSTVQFFDKEITRGDMVEMMYRLQANRTDKVSSTYNEITNPFPTISSCAVLKEKMDEYHYQNQYGYYGRDMLMVEPAMEESTSADEGETASPAPTVSAGANQTKAATDFSETNVQVAGVDEADIIKNDGEYIYLIKGDEVRIVKAYPGTDMDEVARVDFNSEGFYPNEMYVTENRLVVIGQANHYFYTEPMMMEKMIAPYYGNDQTKMFVYDISNHDNIKKLREVSYDGYYQTSRRIGNQVYLVLNASPNYWNWDQIKKGEDFLPTLKDGEKAVEPLVGCTDIRYFPGHKVPRYLITTSVDISAGDTDIERNVFLGSSENVYASTTDLFVASTTYDAESYTDWDWSRDHSKTHVFRFTLKDGDIEFKARGEVPGTILNQFSMDQFNNHFRIATTTGNMWNDENPSTNNVYVLDGNMKQVGSLQDLAPGERIYSTRFMGDRLYMVTFRQVDPLFVIGLSDPKNPKVLGKLKIPGFSEYLHPFDSNHIIGFGKETVEEKNGVMVEGMKVALFDVSNVNDPKQKFAVKIGGRGTSSDLLYNHKALLFDKEKGLLAFPIQVVEKVEPTAVCSEYSYSSCPAGCMAQCTPSSCTPDGICTADCDGANSCIAPTYDQYQTTFSGALVYNVSLDKGFVERGRITHYTAEDILKAGDYWGWDYNKTIQRILYIGEYLYTVAQGGVKASTLDTVKEVDMLELLE